MSRSGNINRFIPGFKFTSVGYISQQIIQFRSDQEPSINFDSIVPVFDLRYYQLNVRVITDHFLKNVNQFKNVNTFSPETNKIRDINKIFIIIFYGTPVPLYTTVGSSRGPLLSSGLWRIAPTKGHYVKTTIRFLDLFIPKNFRCVAKSPDGQQIKKTAFKEEVKEGTTGSFIGRKENELKTGN